MPITKMLKEILEDKGAKVYMTRTTDVDVFGPNASDAEELQARVNVGEKYNSDMFVSCMSILRSIKMLVVFLHTTIRKPIMICA